METTPRSERRWKTVRVFAEEPFAYLDISVGPVSIFGRPGTAGHSVAVMDRTSGHGARTSIDRAEAEAKAVLKAIRSYRRRNAAALAEEEVSRGEDAQR